MNKEDQINADKTIIDLELAIDTASPNPLPNPSQGVLYPIILWNHII